MIAFISKGKIHVEKAFLLQGAWMKRALEIQNSAVQASLWACPRLLLGPNGHKVDWGTIHQALLPRKQLQE